MLAAAAVAVRMAVSSGSADALLAMGAAVGVVIVAGAVAAGAAAAVHWGVGVIAGCYVAYVLAAGPGPDQFSPAVAVALLVSSELAGWAIDCRRRGRDDTAVHWARSRTVVLLAAAAAVLALLTLEGGTIGFKGDAVPALALAALLATIAGLCALMLRFRWKA